MKTHFYLLDLLRNFISTKMRSFLKSPLGDEEKSHKKSLHFGSKANYARGLFIFFSYSISLFSSEGSVIDKARRVDAHIIIGDSSSAVAEAKKMLESYPDEELTHEMLLRSYAFHGDDIAMMKEWKYISQVFPKLVEKRILLEEMCLGILKKGCRSESIMTRLIGYLAVAQAQLPDSVALIRLGLTDTNASLRALNVEIAAHYRDAPLIDEIKDMFLKEQNVEVRIALLKAFAKLKLKEMVPLLSKSLENNFKMSVVEKREMIATIATLKEDVSQEEWIGLLKEGRGWQIELACALMRKWHLNQEISRLENFLEKGTTDVKIEILKTWGFLQRGQPQLLEALTKDTHPEIGITASWALAFLDTKTLEKNFNYWLHCDESRVRSMAASALMMHGKKAIPLAKKILQECDDRFVKANLALNLLKLRIDVEENAEILYSCLFTTREKLMWVEGPFPYVHTSTVSHSPLIPNKPEAANQSIRLEILNLLAIVEYTHAEAAIREFLKENRWEVAGLAAETLLQEGDETAIELVRKLLNDPDKQLQTQSALILAAWGRDSAALTKLIELYGDADRPLKIKILEALGALGDEKALPFLIERLNEPSGIFRMIAACVLLQTLYH